MSVTPEKRPEIIQTTPEWLVVNKPSGWLTIPGRESPHASAGSKTSAPVLITELKTLHPEAMVVHRLDRETSGVMIFARTAEAHKKANGWFQDRKTKKLYEFLSAGRPFAPILKLKDPIEGAPSLTQVEVREIFQEGFFGWARPQTGRRHQIRIHLAKQGFPIWGDTFYKGPEKVSFIGSELLVGRVALHASQLELPSGEKFEAPLPEDFKSWLLKLRSEGTRVS